MLDEFSNGRKGLIDQGKVRHESHRPERIGIPLWIIDYLLVELLETRGFCSEKTPALEVAQQSEHAVAGIPIRLPAHRERYVIKIVVQTMTGLRLYVVIEAPFRGNGQRPFDQVSIHERTPDRGGSSADSERVQGNGPSPPVVKGETGDGIGLIPMVREFLL